MDEHVPEIVVVDDDRSVAKALSTQIALMGYETREFQDPVAALEHLSENRSACAVLDLNMPGLNGLELQSALAELDPPVSLIFVSGAASVQSGVSAMRSGAVNFLEKPLEYADLERAIAEALAQRRQAVLRHGERADAQCRLDRLSERQRAVLMQVVTGAPNKVIAQNLGISERTIKAHRQAIMERLEATSIADLFELVAIVEN